MRRGLLADAAGDRFTLTEWDLASVGNERESQIIVDNPRRFRIDARLALPPAGMVLPAS